MINSFLISFRLKNTYKVNSIIFSLKQLPLVKRILPSSLYSNDGLKILGNIISTIFEISSIFLGKLLYLFLMVYLMSTVYSNSNSFIHIFTLLTIVGALLNTNMFDPSKDKYYAMLLMKMDAKRYTLSNYYYFLLKNLIGFLPFTLLFGLLAKIPLYICLLMPIFVASSKVIYSTICLILYEKKKKITNENLPTPLVWTLVGILLAISYGLPYLNIAITPFIFMIIFTITLIISIFALNKINKTNSYSRIYKKLLNPDVVIFNAKQTVSQNTQANSLKQIDHNIAISSNKKGYKYLNEIFTKRHRKILTGSAKKMTVVITMLMLGIIIVSMIVPESRKTINDTLLMYLPYLLFVMYFINRGTVVTQAMFMNCDHSMLTYRFFRQPKDIILLFKERLNTLIKINIVPALVIALGLPILLFVTGGTDNIINYPIIFLTVISMSIFFSVHYLVLYYLLQPYNKSLEMKSTTYSLISSFTYFIFSFAAGVKLPTLVFGSLMILFSLIYVGVSLIIAYRQAPKTFKIRN